jgi:predicted nucleic acid-binding protein
MITVALDTNILAYAEDTNGATMKRAALDVVAKLPPEATLIPVQALAELFSVLVRKAGRSRENARDAVISWGDSFPLIETSPEVLLAATELSAGHQLGWWDAVMLAAAADAGCRLLLSEDFQDGFTWSGVTVANPFASPRHPLLEALIAGADS